MVESWMIEFFDEYLGKPSLPPNFHQYNQAVAESLRSRAPRASQKTRKNRTKVKAGRKQARQNRCKR